jgi:hypothetical protein
MADDLTDRVAAVGRDAVTKALLAVADGDNALRVAVPGDVVDAAVDNVVFTCASVEWRKSTGRIQG